MAIFRTTSVLTYPLKWCLTSQYHQPLPVPLICHLPYNTEKKKIHDTGPIDPRRQEREVWQHHLNDPMTRVGPLSPRSSAILVAKYLNNHKAVISMTEKSTIPVCVYIAISSGVAHTCIGSTSRSVTLMSTLTQY